MTSWPQVVWSEAQQVIDRVGWPLRLSSSATPEAYFSRLLDDGQHVEAVLYLAHALPRQHVVAWALDCLLDEGLDPDGPLALATSAWLDDASDAHRHAARVAGEDAPPASAEQLLAFSLLFSGGSIAADGQEPVAPPPETCGRFAACAVIRAAVDGPSFEQSITRALTKGQAIARGTEHRF